jgi:transposase
VAKRPTYTKEFKERAVLLTTAEGANIEQVARELEVSQSSLVRWRDEMGVCQSRSGRPARATRDEIDDLRRQLKQVEKEKRALAMENTILKKAAAFFARNQA